VYRGGFLRFVQPAGQPGALGTLEFRDGKGRVRHEWDGFGNEFKMDETDMGNLIVSWNARSGWSTGGQYNKAEKNGHTPPGWWRLFWKAVTDEQRDKESGSGTSKRIKQGGYVRWKQDDAPDAEGRYTTPFVYDASDSNDVTIGEPEAIDFKYEMAVISPTRAQNRSYIQIHPDGKKDGTRGCIGIQSYQECVEVDSTLTNYNGLKFKVEVQQ
jgi:hypothetical protein